MEPVAINLRRVSGQAVEQTRKTNLHTLKLLTIIGFIAAAAGQIMSIFLPSQAMPPWSFAILSGVFPLGLVGLFECMRTGMLKGMWGSGKQLEHASGHYPKCTIKAVMGLLTYNLFLFSVTVAKQILTHSTAKGVSPLFATCTGAMIFYFLLGMVFHAAETGKRV